MKIFLSHTGSDKALVREIRSHLPKQVTTWLDEDDLLLGEGIGRTIKSAIEEDADYVVIFLGKDAVQSEWVMKELKWALKRENELDHVFVLPVLLDDVWDQVEPKKFQERLYLRLNGQSESEVKRVGEELSNQLMSWLVKRLDVAKKN